MKSDGGTLDGKGLIVVFEVLEMKSRPVECERG